MQSTPPLTETLERLETVIAQQGLDRAELLDPAVLATRTALPEATVRTLLDGGPPPAEEVNDRVRHRIHTLVRARLAATGRRMSDLAAEIHRLTGVSEMWARQVCDGKKVPNVEFLHHLVKFFRVDGAESFFTAPADEALNRALLPTLRRLETDPLQPLMDKYGVKGSDLRMHGSMSRAQLERLLEGVLRSVLPEDAGGAR